MSSEIFYAKAFLRVGDRFIPVVNHGSSNCYDFDSRGREIPERHWSVLSYPFRGRLAFTAAEIKQIAAAFEEANTENRGGTCKSRNRAFEVGEFGRWILAGLKSAHTVEEYRAYGNSVVVIDYERNWSKASIASTAELSALWIRGRVIISVSALRMTEISSTRKYPERSSRLILAHLIATMSCSPNKASLLSAAAAVSGRH